MVQRLARRGVTKFRRWDRGSHRWRRRQHPRNRAAALAFDHGSPQAGVRPGRDTSVVASEAPPLRVCFGDQGLCLRYVSRRRPLKLAPLASSSSPRDRRAEAAVSATMAANSASTSSISRSRVLIAGRSRGALTPCRGSAEGRATPCRALQCQDTGAFLFDCLGGAVFEAVFKSFRHYGQKLAQSLASCILPQDLHLPGQIRLSTA